MVSHAERIKNKNKCFDIRRNIERIYHVNLEKRGNYTLIPKRIFCYVCHKLGFSYNEISGALKLNHTTIMYHVKNISQDEVKKADEFIENMENFKIENKSTKNIYEITGFRYDNGKKECSTNWKRVYPLKPLYRGV